MTTKTYILDKFTGSGMRRFTFRSRKAAFNNFWRMASTKNNWVALALTSRGEELAYTSKQL